MTTTTAPTLTRHAAPHAGAPATDRPSLSRLVGVELRKSVDTRAGLWLLIAIAALSLTAAVVSGLSNPDAERGFTDVLSITMIAAAALLPVVGLLAFTSEWSQRTALTTFALVPDRGRVLAAKALAVTVLTLGSLLGCLLLAGLGTAIRPAVDGAGGDFDLTLAGLGEAAAFLGLSVALGVGAGLAILVSAPAIVTYFVAPMLWTVATSALPGLSDVGRWLDTAQTFEALRGASASATDWAQIGTSSALWIVVPLLIGLWRVRRAGVS